MTKITHITKDIKNDDFLVILNQMIDKLNKLHIPPEEIWMTMEEARRGGMRTALDKK